MFLSDQLLVAMSTLPHLHILDMHHSCIFLPQPEMQLMKSFMHRSRHALLSICPRPAREFFPSAILKAGNDSICLSLQADKVLQQFLREFERVYDEWTPDEAVFSGEGQQCPSAPQLWS